MANAVATVVSRFGQRSNQFLNQLGKTVGDGAVSRCGMDPIGRRRATDAAASFRSVLFTRHLPDEPASFDQRKSA